jgi:aryl carrier-like protein
MKTLQQSLFQPGIQHDTPGKPVNKKQLEEWEKLLKVGLDNLRIAELKLQEHLRKLRNKK